MNENLHNSYDPLQSISEIKNSKGSNESQETLFEFLRDEQIPQKSQEQEEKMREYATQLLMEWIRGLSNLKVDFKNYIVDFEMSESSDHSPEKEESVKLVRWLKELILYSLQNTPRCKVDFSDFYDKFRQMRGSLFIEGEKLNMQKMLTVFLNTIQEGLSTGDKKKARNFQDLFFGKVKNQFLQEINDRRFLKEEEGDFEPINLCKSKQGFELSLNNAFVPKKKFLTSSEGEKVEHTHIIWISKPPDIISFILKDEEGSIFEENELIELPSKIALDPFFEENVNKVERFQQKEISEAENARIQQQIEFSQELKDLWTKLSDCQDLVEGKQNQIESSERFLKELKKFKNCVNRQEKAAVYSRNILSWISNQRKLPQEECKEIYVLKQVLFPEEKGQIICQEIKCEEFPSQTFQSPICAFYVKKDIDNSQLSDLRASEEVKKDAGKNREENLKEKVKVGQKLEEIPRELREEVKEERFLIKTEKEEPKIISFCTKSQGADSLWNPINNKTSEQEYFRETSCLFQVLFNEREASRSRDPQKLFEAYELIKQEKRRNSKLKEESIKISNLFLGWFGDLFDLLMKPEKQIEALLVAFENYFTLEELKVEGYRVENNLKDFSGFISRVILLKLFGSVEEFVTQKEALECMEVLDVCRTLAKDKFNPKYKETIKKEAERINLGCEISKEKTEKMQTSFKSRIIKNTSYVKSLIDDPSKDNQQVPDCKIILQKYSKFLSSFEKWISYEMHPEHFKTRDNDSILDENSEFGKWLSSPNFLK